MNYTPNTTRMNIVLPKDLILSLRSVIPRRGISAFLARAAAEKLRALEREKALSELMAAPPTFRGITDAAAYIRRERKRDDKRLKRLGL